MVGLVNMADEQVLLRRSNRPSTVVQYNEDFDDDNDEELEENLNPNSGPESSSKSKKKFLNTESDAPKITTLFKESKGRVRFSKSVASVGSAPESEVEEVSPYYSTAIQVHQSGPVCTSATNLAASNVVEELDIEFEDHLKEEPDEQTETPHQAETSSTFNIGTIDAIRTKIKELNEKLNTLEVENKRLDEENKKYRDKNLQAKLDEENMNYKDKYLQAKKDLAIANSNNQKKSDLVKKCCNQRNAINAMRRKMLDQHANNKVLFDFFEISSKNKNLGDIHEDIMDKYTEKCDQLDSINAEFKEEKERHLQTMRELEEKRNETAKMKEGFDEIRKFMNI